MGSNGDTSDPLIDEVRRRRRELYATCGNDLNKLAEVIQRIQAEQPEKCVDPRAADRGKPPQASDQP